MRRSGSAPGDLRAFVHGATSSLSCSRPPGPGLAAKFSGCYSVLSGGEPIDCACASRSRNGDAAAGGPASGPGALHNGTGSSNSTVAAILGEGKAPTDADRNSMQLAALRDRVCGWLPNANRCNPDTTRRRHPHIGTLLLHLDLLYDLLDGLPAAFVWKVKQEAKKKTPQPLPTALPLPDSIMNFSAAALWRAMGRGEPDPTEKERKPDAQLLLSRCTIALSSDLTTVEVHHAHEVSLVPLNHVDDVSGGPFDTLSGGDRLDEWCAAMKLFDGKRLSLRFFKRRQVEPFVAVVIALMNLMKESTDNDTASQCSADDSAGGSRRSKSAARSMEWC